MKISISWLKQLVNLNCSLDELTTLLPLKSISTKEVTDKFIELDMKGYNRADLLSLRGVAQEVAAITGSKVSFEELQEAQFVWNQKNSANTKVTISNLEYAPFYTITKIEGLKVESSPREWVEKLEASGIRSIDNVTDITNLIMLEYGQPMHAFDAKAVKNEEIIVRTAKEGERITTLDGKTRDLENSDLLISDPLNALGLAGVMGGKDSEINKATTTILLEAALFDPVNLRKTATRLGLSSEASKRFQHGLTKKRLLQALNAAIKMYESLGGIVTASTMVGDFEDKVRKIHLTKTKLDELVGVEIPKEDVESYLKSLSFHLEDVGTDSWGVTVPYWRLDIELEEDLIEEVARMYGYDKIPAVRVSESKPLQSEDPIFKKISDLRQKLVSSGLTEVQTYSFYSTEVMGALGFNESNVNILVKIANPISSETEVLRMNLWPNLVEAVGRNMRKGYKDIGIFEIGKAFNVSTDGNPTEDYRLAIALSNETDNPLEELYQISKDLGSNLRGYKLDKTLFHPKRQMEGLAEVHLRVLNELRIEKRVAILEIDLN